MKETIQLIKNDGSVLFKHTQQDNSITKTLNEFINIQNCKDLSNIDLSNKNLEGLSFENMNLIGANFKSANLKNVTFDFANLNRANFSNAHLIDSSFNHTYLNVSNFKNADLSNTNLSDADLVWADLVNANLSWANLKWANLNMADLSGANLSEANLSKANLRYTDLSEANLSEAKLIGANLNSANLYAANLRGANLRGANLYAAALKHTKLDGVIISEETQFFAFQCPSEGSFIGWKKAGTTVIKLLIPEDAQRSSATTLKCRCSKAKVLDIQNLDGSKHSVSQVKSDYDLNFIYEIGKIIEVSNFDENRWEECSSGIHFFMSKEIAINY